MKWRFEAMKIHTITTFALGFVLAGTSLTSREIGFVEKFSLADNREEALKELVSGTPEYYYYSSLHALSKGDHQEVERLMKIWVKRYGHTQQTKEIENRSAMLRYGKNPQATLDHVKRVLNLRFNHSRVVEGRKPAHPTELDPALISFERYLKLALTRHKNLQGVEDRGLNKLDPDKLNEIQLRHFIGRLHRPDVPDLPALILKDLRNKHSRGFGSHAIHRNLTRAQMDNLLQIHREFIDNANFVHAYLPKLAPSADVDPVQDDAEMGKWLNRQLGFTRALSPAFNSLKANVLHHTLVFKRKQGVWDRELFMEYLKLPRYTNYVNPVWRDAEIKRRRDCRVDLNADYGSRGGFSRIGNDDSLVRSYLLHFFRQDKDYGAYLKYVRDTYLEDLFAEAKLTAGLGNPERWYSMLNSGQVQAIKDRVDLDFAYSSKERFAPGEEVEVSLWVKNVDSLLVKEFEINAFNYYLRKGKEVDTGIELDGLSATRERTIDFKEPSMRRIARTFAFPELKKRGVYVVEFIGNGISSRVLVRKGALRLLEKVGPAGHEFRVLDEANKARPEASVWLDGKEHKADKKGLVHLPFSNRPSPRTVILRDGDFSSLAGFGHLGENYELRAGFHVDREALLSGRKTKIVVRPSLRVNGRPTSLALLDEVKLVLLAVDYEGTPNRTEVAIDELKEGEDYLHEFTVPEKLLRLSVSLEGKIENLSQGNKQNLQDSSTFSVNAIERGGFVDALHLGWSQDGYSLDVLGKNGEARIDRPVALEVKHSAFRESQNISLKSDQAGKIGLGGLRAIEWIAARNADGQVYRWFIAGQKEGRVAQPSQVHTASDEDVRLAVGGAWNEGKEEAKCALYEKRGAFYVTDHVDQASYRNGFLTLSDLSPGDYELFLRDTGETVQIRVTAGERRFGFVTSGNRILEDNRVDPLQITNLSVKGGKLRAKVVNAHAFTRVHVLATRYVPRFEAHGALDHGSMPSPYWMRLSSPRALYVAERDIGEEYRYVLERGQAEKFPGNMLTRPGLILNPWSVRTTSTTLQDALQGDEYLSLQDSSDMKKEGGAGTGGRGGGLVDFANLDFLKEGTFLAANLEPDEDGFVEVDLPKGAGLRQVRVVAADPVQLASAVAALPESPIVRRELRMISDLDPQKAFAEQKRMTLVDAGKAFELADATTSQLHVVDDLGDAHDLLLTLRDDATLREFGFVLNWPDMKEQEKREKYSKYACHELHFFLLQKDPKFFDRVVKPYLANKKEPTFLDDWFLGRDLKKYLDPFRFGQLNAFEKILLARKGPAAAASMTRYVRDKWELIPPNPEEFDRLFEVALKTAALDGAGSDGDGLAKLGQVQLEGREMLARKLLQESGERTEYARGRAEAPAKPKASIANGGFLSGFNADISAINSTAIVDELAADTALLRSSDKSALIFDKKSNLGRDRQAWNAAGIIGKEADAQTDYFYARAGQRGAARQFFRQLEATEEWAENNYYHVPKEQRNGSLVQVNAFWRDYAAAAPGKPFFSGNIVYATRNFTEMLLALAVLDLPFEAKEHEIKTEGRKFRLEAATPLVAFHEELLETEAPKGPRDILLSQRFYRLDSRYRYENGERVDNFVDEEFLKGVAHGCHVTLTNPTSSRRKLRLLLQIPAGAIPLNRGYFSKSFPVTMEGYSTKTFDYAFYFPESGKYPVYPAQVSSAKGAVAGAEVFAFNVVDVLTRKDKGSWAWISQNGSSKDVIQYLTDNNLNRLDLSKIAFRFRSQAEGGSGRAFYEIALKLLAGRFHFDSTLWSYAVYHKDEPRMREFLAKSSLAGVCGAHLRSPLLDVDPVERRWYEQLEYSPLVNARTHKLGKTRQVVNNRFHEQYHRFLNILKYKASPDADDVLGATYYLFLQDRVEEGIGFFGKVDPVAVDEKLQYDYLTSYVAFYEGDVAKAKKLAAKYADYPVDRWKKRFASVTGQVKEIEQGVAPKVIDEENREQKIEDLAATEPAFDFEVKDGEVTINYRNLKDARINFYPMEVELLFSRRPFVSDDTEQFTFVLPNGTQNVKLPVAENHVFALPAKYREGNVMIEIEAGGIRKAKAYYANRLRVEMTESYGRVRVTGEENAKPLASTYVKVYARMNDGRVKFYKDGYTDLRGKFDYVSLNTGQLDGVDRFAVLVLHDEAGAMIREAKPPKQ